jgi:DNA-binding transcriptional LysR family regulator
VLRYFLEVAGTGSISQASERLHVAASAISRQIAKLEHDLGVPLFERRPRGMVLSEAGELPAAYARRSRLESEQVIEEIRGLSALRHSVIRLASSEGFARDLLSEAIVAFRESYPGVRFRLRVDAPSAATDAVREGAADLAVTYALAPEPDIKVEYSAIPARSTDSCRTTAVSPSRVRSRTGGGWGPTGWWPCPSATRSCPAVASRFSRWPGGPCRRPSPRSSSISSRTSTGHHRPYGDSLLQRAGHGLDDHLGQVAGLLVELP